MSQRNPMNERYRDENRGGKTRKSAASAKPTAVRAATVRDPAPKTKKQKKAEAREREQERERKQRFYVETPDNKPIEQLPEYKRLRRLWWISLGSAVFFVVISVLAAGQESLSFLYLPSLILGYVLVIIAFYIDFGKIRKLRKQHEQKVMQGKSKEARAAQKKAHAEMLARQKEAEQEQAAESTEEKQGGFLSRLIKPKQKSADAASESEGKQS